MRSGRPEVLVCIVKYASTMSKHQSFGTWLHCTVSLLKHTRIVILVSYTKMPCSASKGRRLRRYAPVRANLMDATKPFRSSSIFKTLSSKGTLSYGAWLPQNASVTGTSRRAKMWFEPVALTLSTKFYYLSALVTIYSFKRILVRSLLKKDFNTVKWHCLDMATAR